MLVYYVQKNITMCAMISHNNKEKITNKYALRYYCIFLFMNIKRKINKEILYDTRTHFD